MIEINIKWHTFWAHIARVPSAHFPLPIANIVYQLRMAHMFAYTQRCDRTLSPSWWTDRIFNFFFASDANLRCTSLYVVSRQAKLSHVHHASRWQFSPKTTAARSEVSAISSVCHHKSATPYDVHASCIVRICRDRKVGWVYFSCICSNYYHEM